MTDMGQAKGNNVTFEQVTVSGLMTLTDVASVLNVSTQTVRRLINEGSLASVKVGSGSLRVSGDDLTGFIISRRVQVQPEE